MDDKSARELTPEQLAVSQKRKERREQKKHKKEAQEKHQSAPQQQPVRFLVRSWINLPEVDEALTKDRVRVMTWNVRPIVSRRSLSKPQSEI